MKAEKIIYLTGAPGLLEDPADPASLVHRLTAAEARQRIADESVTGGMIPKLLACAEAVEGGVGSAHMIDGRAEHAILVELFTDEGIGTMVSGEMRPMTGQEPAPADDRRLASRAPRRQPGGSGRAAVAGRNCRDPGDRQPRPRWSLARSS